MLKGLRRDLATRFSAGGWLPVLARVDQGAVALTFDDGPSPVATPQVLEVLARFGARATFFFSGRRVESRPDLVRAVVEAGHQVFSHGFDHVRMDQRPGSSMTDDLDRAEALLSRQRPTPSPYLVRLPYGSGHRSQAVHRALGAWRPDCRIVHWRYDFKDFGLVQGCASVDALRLRCAAAAEAAVRSRRLPGAIALLHEEALDIDHPLSAHTAPLLLAELLRRLAHEGLTTVALAPASRVPPWTAFVRTVGME